MGTVEEFADTTSESRLERGVEYLQQNSRTYLLIAPAAIFLLSVVGYPIIETFRLSLYESPADSSVETYVGIQHYVEIFSSDIFYQLLWQTGRWVVVVGWLGRRCSVF